MASFKKRVFGSEVSEDIILEFDKLGTGGQIVETKITPRPLISILLFYIVYKCTLQ